MSYIEIDIQDPEDSLSTITTYWFVYHANFGYVDTTGEIHMAAFTEVSVSGNPVIDSRLPQLLRVGVEENGQTLPTDATITLSIPYTELVQTGVFNPTKDNVFDAIKTRKFLYLSSPLDFSLGVIH